MTYLHPFLSNTGQSYDQEPEPDDEAENEAIERFGLHSNVELSYDFKWRFVFLYVPCLIGYQ